MQRVGIFAALAAAVVLGWAGSEIVEAPLALCLSSLPAVAPGDLFKISSWSFHPAFMLPIVALPLFSRGVNGVGGRLALFGACLALAIALISPLCRLAATLASAHMLQHLLLVAVAPALLVLAFGRPNRDPPLGAGTGALLYAVAIWVAHVPAFYALALANPAVHLLLVLGLLAAGCLFWRTLLDPLVAGRNDYVLASLIAGLATLVNTGLLGALLTFATRPWYPVYAGRTEFWNLSPLADQQIAGLVMWVPMGLLLLLVALGTFGAFLKRLAADANARSADPVGGS